MTRETIKATGWGTLVTLIVAIFIVIGSRNLSHFDAALVGYTFAILFATFGDHVPLRDVAAAAADRALLETRMADLFCGRGIWLATVAMWFARLTHEFAFNHFIARRGASRWGAHMADYVGMPDRDRHHLPAGLRVDSFRNAARGFELGIAPTFSVFPTFAFPVHSLDGIPDIPRFGLGLDPGNAGVMLAMRRRMQDHGAAAAAAVRRGLPAADPARSPSASRG